MGSQYATIIEIGFDYKSKNLSVFWNLIMLLLFACLRSFSLHRAFVFPWSDIIKMVNSLLQRNQLLIILHYLPILFRTSSPNICSLYCIIYLSSYHLRTLTLAVELLTRSSFLASGLLPGTIDLPCPLRRFSFWCCDQQLLCVCFSATVA